MQVPTSKRLALALGAALLTPLALAAAPQQTGSTTDPAAQQSYPATQTDTTNRNPTGTPPATDKSTGQAMGGTSSGSSSTSKTYSSSSFKSLDTDGDGRISSLEASADESVNGAFATMDTNGDGYVSDSEYKAYHSGKHK